MCVHGCHQMNFKGLSPPLSHPQAYKVILEDMRILNIGGGESRD